MYYANGEPIFKETDRDRQNGVPRPEVEVEKTSDDDGSKFIVGFALFLFALLVMGLFFVSIKVGVCFLLLLLFVKTPISALLLVVLFLTWY